MAIKSDFVPLVFFFKKKMWRTFFWFNGPKEEGNLNLNHFAFALARHHLAIYFLFLYFYNLSSLLYVGLLLALSCPLTLAFF